MIIIISYLPPFSGYHRLEKCFILGKSRRAGINSKLWLRSRVNWDTNSDNWLDSVLRRIGNISAIYRRLFVNIDQFGNFEVSLAVLTSLLFFEIQWKGLLRAKGVVILNTGHNYYELYAVTKYCLQTWRMLFGLKSW